LDETDEKRKRSATTATIDAIQRGRMTTHKRNNKKNEDITQKIDRIKIDHNKINPISTTIHPSNSAAAKKGGEHYFTKTPTSEKNIQQFKVACMDHLFTFETASGLFSLDRLDKGSEEFLENMDIPHKGSVLDLGCGWGPIAIIIKTIHPQLEVVASDVNERAIQQTRRNAYLNDVELTAKQSDGFEKINESFDVILLNPPQSAGKSLCLRLIKESKDHLHKGGSLQIVARTNKGGKSFCAFMEEEFGNCEKIGGGSGYSIYKSIV